MFLKKLFTLRHMFGKFGAPCEKSIACRASKRFEYLVHINNVTYMVVISQESCYGINHRKERSTKSPLIPPSEASNPYSKMFTSASHSTKWRSSNPTPRKFWTDKCRLAVRQALNNFFVYSSTLSFTFGAYTQPLASKGCHCNFLSWTCKRGS